MKFLKENKYFINILCYNNQKSIYSTFFKVDKHQQSKWLSICISRQQARLIYIVDFQ